jgi:hypothetical protein
VTDLVVIGQLAPDLVTVTSQTMCKRQHTLKEERVPLHAIWYTDHEMMMMSRIYHATSHHQDLTEVENTEETETTTMIHHHEDVPAVR